MPNRVPAVRYTATRRSSMRTLSSSDGVSWHTLMGYPSYARNRACALPSPSPFHYVIAKIVPVVQLAAHVKSSTLYGHTYVRSYGRTTKFFRLDGLLLFRIVKGLRSASSAIKNILEACRKSKSNCQIIFYWGTCGSPVIKCLCFFAFFSLRHKMEKLRNSTQW